MNPVLIRVILLTGMNTVEVFICVHTIRLSVHICVSTENNAFLFNSVYLWYLHDVKCSFDLFIWTCAYHSPFHEYLEYIFTILLFLGIHSLPGFTFTNSAIINNHLLANWCSDPECFALYFCHKFMAPHF